MRMLVFFDLPTLTPVNRQNYRQFRKLLVTNGFIMLQESVYCKLITTPTVENSVKRLIEKNKPPEGLIQLLTVTEKQYSKMDFIVGSSTNDIVDNKERLVIL